MVTLAEIDAEIARRQGAAPSLSAIDAEIARRKEAEPEGFFGASVIEPAATLVSGAIAEPIAGLAGIAQSVNPFAEPGAGAEAVEATREALTFQPRTEAGQESLETVGEAIQPVAEAFGEAEQTLGDIGFEVAGPVGGAIGKAIPTLLLELAGAASAKGITKLKTGKEVDKLIKEAAPSTEQLKDASRTVFKEIEDLGVTVKPDGFQALTRNIEKAAREVGASPRTTKTVFGVIDDFKEVAERGTPITLSELDELRTVAQNAAKSLDPAQKAPAVAIIDEIDGFLEGAGSGILNKPKGAPNIGAEYKAARQMWGRARKGELLTEAIEKAKDTASGFENGLRIEFRKILKNKRQSKFLNADEKAAMNQVSRGTKASNLAKLLGRLGISEGQAINIVNPLVGGAAAGAVLGTPGAVAVPIIGQVSKQLAQRLTQGNAKFAQQVVNAGNNAEQITKAYVRNTPKGQRSSIELSELLLRNEVDLNTARSALAKDSADIVKQGQRARQGAVVGGTLRPEN
jgi:hypothetical protein